VSITGRWAGSRVTALLGARAIAGIGADCRLEISVPVCWQKHRTAIQNGLRFPDR